MALSMVYSEFMVERDKQKCIACRVCVNQCANDVHSHDPEDDEVTSDSLHCVGCQRCATLCPTQAITIRSNPLQFKENANWTALAIRRIYKQAETAGVLLTGMGNDRPYPIYWDHILLNASQVTNPSIDPLREPMELRTFIGSKPDRLQIDSTDESRLETEPPPQ